MKILKLLYITGFLLFFFILNTIAQEFYSENISVKPGLPDNAIRSVFKDSRGYYWLGTEAGVCKWDGETFLTYNTLDGLAGNNVWCIDEDNEGKLWFACYGGGISSFDGKQFISYKQKDGLPDNFIRIVKWDTYRDCLLIGTSRSISVLKDSTFYNFTVQNGELRKKVIITAILSDTIQILFLDFANHNHIMKFKNNSKPELYELNSSKWDNKGVSSVSIFNNGDTITGWSRKGIIIMSDNELKEFDNIGQVFDVAKDNLNWYWIASWNGGGISPPGGLFKIKGDEVVSLNKAYRIKSIKGWEMYYDTCQQMIFYGTLDEGLYKIPPPVFEYYNQEYFGEKDLKVTDLEIDDKNNIWFNTNSALYVWDQKEFRKFELNYFFEIRKEQEKSLISDIPIDVRLKELSFNYYNKQLFIRNIEFDSKKNAWISASVLGYYKFSDGNLENVRNIPRGVVNFKFDENDTLFGAGHWSSDLRKFPDFENSNGFVSIKDSKHIFYPRKIIQFRNETWLCSRYEGVFMYKDGLLRTITDEDTTINKLVSDICFDSEGYAYLGGRDGRVEILSPDTRKKFFEFDADELNQSVEWVNISGGNLFVGYNTKMRLIPINELKRKKILSQYFFGKSDGYIPAKVSSSRLDKKNNIWLATDQGLVKINTKNIKVQDLKPLKTIIRKAALFNEPTDWSKYSASNSWSKLPENTMKLHHTQNHLSIYYHTLNFNNPENEAYFYRLDGSDKKWHGPSDKDYVVYPFLNPGKYIFRVKSLNKHSNLFSREARFSFIILTPWHKQWWFLLLVIIMLIGFSLLGFHLRLNYVRKAEKKKREVLSKITELETKALQAQINPHFIFNSMNSIQNFVLDNDVDDALIYLNSFSKIIRMTLDFVDKKFISLSDEINYLRYYVQLENMRFDELFDFEVDMDLEIDPETTFIPPMLLQPIIENSIKHGIIPLKDRKGRIILKIEKLNNDHFRCIIEDSGIGRKEAEKLKEKQLKKRESRGLKITEDRLRMLDKDNKSLFQVHVEDLFDNDGQAIGTKIKITLPFIFS